MNIPISFDWQTQPWYYKLQGATVGMNDLLTEILEGNTEGDARRSYLIWREFPDACVLCDLGSTSAWIVLSLGYINTTGYQLGLGFFAYDAINCFNGKFFGIWVTWTRKYFRLRMLAFGLGMTEASLKCNEDKLVQIWFLLFPFVSVGLLHFIKYLLFRGSKKYGSGNNFLR